MKTTKENPYFALDIDSGLIVSDFGDQMTISEFKDVFERTEHPLDMTLMVQRLISYDFDIVELRDHYLV